jgi:hypothetical protein
MFLLLLYTLGVAFLVVTIIQWEIVEAWFDDVRAREIAENGIYEAINRLYLTFPIQVSYPELPCIWRYWGDNTSEDDSDQNKNFTPIEYAQNPSFAEEIDGDPFNEDVQPKLIKVTFPWGVTKKIGFSGVSPKGMGRYALGGEIFSLKIIDTSSQFYINEGLGHPYNSAVIRRMLNTLGMYLKWHAGMEEVPENLGDLIISNRPPVGYACKQELLRFLSHKVYLKVKHFICANTWVDRKVYNPVPLSTHEEVTVWYDPEIFDTRPIWKGNILARYGRSLFSASLPPPNQLFFNPLYEATHVYNQQSHVWAQDELNPAWIEITSRAPININTASKAVLVAVLSYLEGFFVLEQLRAFYGFSWDTYNFYYGPPKPGYQDAPKTIPSLGRVYRTIPLEGPGSTQIYNNALIIADKIIERRSVKPFNSWKDFNSFIDALVGEVLLDLRGVNYFNEPVGWRSDARMASNQYIIKLTSQAIADVIKANANPNLHLNEINPDENLWQWVDKTDLIKNSTEFCFLPTGVFEIESQGLVLKPKEGFNSLQEGVHNIVK